MDNTKKKTKLKQYLIKRKYKLITGNCNIIKTRASFEFFKKNNDIYINNKTDFKVYLKLCQNLLNSDIKEVILHSLGSAIIRAYNLALYLKIIHCGTLELEIKTTTVNLMDDLEPKNDDAEYKTNKRLNSAIRIRIFPIELIKLLKFND